MSKQENIDKSNRIRQAIERRKEWFENLTPPCPNDGLLSRFVNYDGSYTRVRGKFVCKNGHEFYYG